MRIAGAVFLGIAALLGLTIIFGSWYTIDQTQRGVFLRNGAFVEVVEPGLHFKWPWVDSVSKVDMMTHTRTWDKMESYTSDQQPVHLRISVTMHLAMDKTKELYERFGGNLEGAIDRLLSPRVPDRSKVILGRYTAQRVISERGQYNLDVDKALRDALAYDPIFIIDSVQVEDIAFSPEYIKSVEARMTAEVQVSREEQNLKQERIKANIAIAQADGRAGSVIAEAKAASESARLRGEGDAAAIRAKGEAEASIVQAKGDALSKNPGLVNLTQAEKWNGVLPTTMLPGGSVPMLALGGTR